MLSDENAFRTRLDEYKEYHEGSSRDELILRSRNIGVEELRNVVIMRFRELDQKIITEFRNLIIH